jgi:hypothetical protein
MKRSLRRDCGAWPMQTFDTRRLQVARQRTAVPAADANLTGVDFLLWVVDMDWTNRATEQVAEFIRVEDRERPCYPWSNLVEEILDTVSDDRDVAEKCLALTVRQLCAGSPEMCTDGVFRENADQPEEMIDFADLLGIDYAAVDWRQVAAALIDRFHQH